MLAYLPTSGDPATSLLFRLQMNTGIRKCKWTFFPPVYCMWPIVEPKAAKTVDHNGEASALAVTERLHQPDDLQGH